MGKKRVRKLTVIGVVEGNREQNFIDFLRGIYKPEDNNISFYPEHTSGGTPDRLVNSAIIGCDRDKSFTWFDEDFEPAHGLSRELRQKLARCWGIEANEEFLNCPLRDLQSRYNANNKKPTLIISCPVCVESLIIKILGHAPPYSTYEHDKRDLQIKGLKDRLKQLIGSKNELQFYRDNITKEDLESLRADIPQLDMLISALTE